MKTTKISLFFALFVISVTQSFSQIKVNANGESKFGNVWVNFDGSSNDYNNEVSHEFFGLNTTSYRPGSRISFGDYGSSANSGANVFMGEWTTGDSDGMQVHGKNGIFFTTGGVGNYDVGKFIGSDFFLRGSIYANAPQYFSDIRLKKNIQSLTDALTTIKNLKGITYDWKTDKDEARLLALSNIRPVEAKGT